MSILLLQEVDLSARGKLEKRCQGMELWRQLT